MTEWSGLFESMPAAEYHQRELGVASKSALDLVHRTPATYFDWIHGHDAAPTSALVIGSAFHCAILEPERFATAYVCEPDFGDCRSRDNKARRDAWRSAHAGATYLSEDDTVCVLGMAASVRKHRIAGRMIQDGKAEVTARWTDDATGLRCKARADFIIPELKMAVDLKSTLDASPQEFARSIAKHGYHRQDAFYRAGFSQVGAPIEHFAFISVEKTPPYLVAVYQLDEHGIAKGHESIRRDMETLAQCIEDNSFPGYPDGIHTIALPKWAA